MSEIQLNINTFVKARKFYSVIRQFEGKFTLKQDEYDVDALSQLGIFSLDLSRPLVLQYETTAPQEQFLHALDEFIV